MTSYTDEQVLNAIEYHGFTGQRCSPEMVASLLADRIRLQAEVVALRAAINKGPSITADDLHWFEPVFMAWNCGDYAGVLDGLESASNYFMPDLPTESQIASARAKKGNV